MRLTRSHGEDEMITYDALKPYGAALKAFTGGEKDAVLVYERDDGFREEHSVIIFFREPSEFFPSERLAMDLCVGQILVIGAGAGIHARLLEKRGYLVTAIDICPESVDVMTEAGVQDARCADIMDMASGDYDTLLLMGRGIGLVENLEGLDLFLNHVKHLMHPDGHLLVNALDVTKSDISEHRAYQDANIQAGRYVGEIRLRLHYRELIGDPFTWLHVDPETLSQHAVQAGWHTEIIKQDESGDYLARLIID
jgi:SAM-dependent methyltransferase